MEVIKKHPVWVVAAICAVILIIAFLWYTRPMTLEQLCPDLKLEECREIRGYYTDDWSSGPHEFTLSAESQAFASLMEQFRDRTFRRSLLGLLQGTRTHTGGGQTWDVYFEFEDVPFSDGSINSGSLLNIHNFYGTVDISFAIGNSWREVSTEGKNQWVDGVFQIISAKDG